MRCNLVLVLAACAVATFSSPVFADGGHSHGRASIGEPGQPAAPARTIEVSMDDSMRFTPSSIDVRRGETIRFVVRNHGQAKHELVLGRIADLQAHAALMKKFPNMQHDEPNMVSVAPGATAELRWKFSRAGTVDFACLEPGHYDAGMRGRLTVTN